MYDLPRISGNHWMLFNINMRQHVILIYDSLDRDSSYYDKYYNLMRYVLEIIFGVDKWGFFVDFCDKQKNGSGK